MGIIFIPVSRRVVLLCLWEVSKNLPSSTCAGIIFSTRVGAWLCAVLGRTTRVHPLSVRVLFFIPVSGFVVLWCFGAHHKNTPSSLRVRVLFLIPVLGACGFMRFWGAPKDMSSSPCAGIIFYTRVWMCGFMMFWVAPKSTSPLCVRVLFLIPVLECGSVLLVSVPQEYSLFPVCGYYF